MKPRLTVPAKVRALLQQEIDSTCPFCGSVEVAHFHIHHIDEDPCNNDFGNLLMTCVTCHSKITKRDISQAEVYAKKLILRNRRTNVIPMPSRATNVIKNVKNSVVGNNNKVTFNFPQKPTRKVKYPPGSVGYEVAEGNYVSYLIERYHQLKESEVGKQAMNYAIFPSMLKKKFKIGAGRSIYNLPILRFEDLIHEIQVRIEGTMVGRMKRGQRLYETFEEYSARHVRP